MEQPRAAKPAVPAIEEPPATRPTSPGGGAHDEGDPGDEGLWSATVASADPTGAEVGTAGDAPNSAAWDLPTVAEQVVASMLLSVGTELG